MEINFNVLFSTNDSFTCNFGEGVTTGDYSGPYEVTPSNETQTLATAGKTLESNVTINPIPSNYGLITWDGNILTVS